MSSDRFAVLSDEVKQKIIEDGDSVSTKKSTETAVGVFREYLKAKKLPQDFVNLRKDQLNTILSNFYMEARNRKGEHYKKTTLIAYRHGLQRHFNGKRTVNTVDIIGGEEFVSSAKSFKCMTKELKRTGNAAIQHHPCISDLDLEKAYAVLTDGHLEDAKLLQYKVFLDIMLHFGRRGRENLAEIRRQDFAVTHDENGAMYVYQTRDEKTKNHQDDSERSSDGRMYEILGSDRCPVRSFVKYVRRLNPKCQAFFQHPKQEPVDKVYYNNVALGHNKLGKFMGDISILAGLSQRYTNHSCRATTVHVLDAAHVPSRHIMTVTGHRSESSLKTYSGKTDNATKKLMSQTISAKTKGRTSNMQSTSTEYSNSLLDIEPTLECLTDSQSDQLLKDFETDDGFDNMLQTIDTSQMNVNMPNAASRLPMPIMYNCQNITINYNVQNMS